MSQAAAARPLLPELLDFLQAPRNCAIIPHLRPDGDAIGSTLGLMHALRAMGHSAQVYAPTEVPDDFFFLEGAAAIRHAEAAPGACQEAIQAADVVFALDFGAVHRSGELAQALLDSPARKVNIDHHQNPEAFATERLHDTQASSTCELVYRLLDSWQQLERLPAAGADALFTGILTDTGNFRHARLSPGLFRAAARLMELGANVPRINHYLHNHNRPDRMKLQAAAIAEKLIVKPELRTAYFKLDADFLARFEAGLTGTEGLVNQGLSLAGINLAVLLKEDRERGEIRLSFRSVGQFAANQLAATFGGGGHYNAAGGRSTQSMAATEAALLHYLAAHTSELQYEPYS